VSKILGGKKIILEDFEPEQRKWLPKLISPLNQFMESVYSALQKGLTISENLRAEVYKRTLPAGSSTQSLAWNLNQQPTAVLLGQITDTAGNIPVSQVGIMWTFRDNSITITYDGLDSNTSYRTTIIGLV
jgi:hypothetical protein